MAEDQEEYQAIDVAVVRHPDYSDAFPNSRVMAFRPSAEELAQLNAGADLYIGLLTFDRPQQPIIVAVGKETMAEIYKLETTFCKACSEGHVFTNTAPLYPGYKPGDPSLPELCAKHNARGHHHILWNGTVNETVECGSERCNELTRQFNMRDHQRERRERHLRSLD